MYVVNIKIIETFLQQIGNGKITKNETKTKQILQNSNSLASYQCPAHRAVRLHLNELGNTPLTCLSTEQETVKHWEETVLGRVKHQHQVAVIILDNLFF